MHHTASKIAKCIGVICKARQYLNNYYLINLYHAFMLPYMNYCIHVWGGTSSSTSAPIFRIQKIAIRSLLKMKKRSSISDAVKKINILKLNGFVFI